MNYNESRKYVHFIYIYILYATIFVNPYQKKNLKKNEQFLCAKI